TDQNEPMRRPYIIRRLLPDQKRLSLTISSLLNMNYAPLFRPSIADPKRARSCPGERAGDWASGGGFQFLRERRMAQLLERFAFDLPDTLASNPEEAPDLIERMLLAAPVEAEAQPDDLLFARGERAQRLVGDRPQFRRFDPLHLAREEGIFDQLPEFRIAFVADRGLERNRLDGSLQGAADLLRRHFHPTGDLLNHGIAPQFPSQRARGGADFAEQIRHVHRQANDARLIGDRACDGLPDPPRRIGREFIAAPPIELLDRPHQADVPLLNQVED